EFNKKVDFIFLNDLYLSKGYLKNFDFKDEEDYISFLERKGYKLKKIIGKCFKFPLLPYSPSPVCNDWYFPFLRIKIFKSSTDFW
ncbi:MAG: hypothetical protein DRI36_03575, partial [Caldiserica bacterium]